MSIQSKKWILALGLVFGQILATAPPAHAQVVFNDWSTATTSFFDTCSGEVVNLTIESHIVIRLVGTDPDGTQHFRTHVNFKGDGVGVSSGAKYRYLGNSQREHSLAPGCVGSGEVETYTRLISQGNSGNRYVRTTVQLMAQLSGSNCILVPAGVPTISVTCHG